MCLQVKEVTDVKEVTTLWTVAADLGGSQTGTYNKFFAYFMLGVGVPLEDLTRYTVYKEYPIKWKLTDMNMLVHREYVHRKQRRSRA